METTTRAKKLLGLVIGGGVLLAGGVALAMTPKKKKQPTGPTVVAPDVPGVERGPNEAPVLTPRDQVFAAITEAFYRETDPAVLRSLAAQARMQADSGAYSAGDAAKLRTMAQQLDDRAATLEASGAAMTAEQAAKDTIAKMNAAFYQETDPAILRSLADQATTMANAGAYPQGYKSQVLNAAEQLRKRADALAAQGPVQMTVSPPPIQQQSPGFVPSQPAQPVVSIDLPDGNTVDIPKPVADAIPAGLPASIPLPDGQTLELPPEVTQAVADAAAQLPALQTATQGKPIPMDLPNPLTVPPAPSQQQVEQPSLVAEDTAAAADALLTAEGLANWKRKEPILQPWQESRGLKPDQEFGPKSALKMAEEIGTVPIVRFWPKGALKDKAVGDYRAALYAMASSAPEPRKSQLRASAAREQGQGFERNPKPVTPLFQLELA